MTVPPDLRQQQPLSPEEHREFIERRFRAVAPALADEAWDCGLVMLNDLNATGRGLDVRRSVHRSSCSTVALLATVPPEWAPAPVWPVTSPYEINEGHGRCTTCGTDTLPSGAVLATDTIETVLARAEALRTDRRLAEYRQARADALATAQRKAMHQVLAAHAAETDALATRYSQEALADLDARYPDVSVEDIVHPDLSVADIVHSDEFGGPLAG